VLADQWKEFFYCEAIPTDVLATKGMKRTSAKSANVKGSDNIITQGSVIAVADGQCMIIVDNGKVAEICAEPGEYTYDSSTEPTIFSGNLADSIMDTMKNIGKRFTFGGDAPKDQRVYYFNTKEIIGNKYGTPAPVQFRVLDKNTGLDLDVDLRASGEYSYRITNPILFYTNVCGNVEQDYKRGQIDSQLKAEVITALRPALGKISALGIRPSELTLHEKELRKNINDELSDEWRDRRGIEMVSFTIPNANVSEEHMKILRDFQQRVMLTNPNMAAATLVGAQANAMEAAASNSGGAMMGFMGLNQATQAGGMNAQNLFAMGQQQQAAAPPPAPAPAAADGWTCSCGVSNSGKFCAECGGQKPEPAAGWTCPCGANNSGKFCAECGSSKPVSNDWTCACGKANTGKFCADCGKPRG
jgi:membrane protease subunit (stomatin/prohibitin family)